MSRPENPPESSPSNPVAPTTLFVAFREGKNAESVNEPVALVPSPDRTASALEKMAEALTALLHAQNRVPPASIRTSPDISVREVINEFLVVKARAARSDRYLRQLRVSLSSFAAMRVNVPIANVTLLDCERWIFGQNWKPATMDGYLGDVSTLFNFAIRRGYTTENPTRGVELPEDDSDMEPPQIHTPEQAAKLLNFCRERGELDVLRMLAVRYFSGTRSAEAHRMREENLLLNRGYVEITARKAKTRKRRLVKIQPVLASWLALGGELRAMHTSTVSAVIKASGVDFPKNVTRHSFCSYRLAQTQNAALTALEAGHSETMLFGKYRECVTEQDAAVFWELTPERAASLCRPS
jgi:integrase